MPTATANPPASQEAKLITAFRSHWREYLMEAGCLGIFMISACVFGVLLEHPSSAVYQVLANTGAFRRVVAGMAMGLTAIGIFYSPWGQRSGAHMNPAVTLTFLSLGKITPWDALFYIVFQFLGGITGVLVAGVLIGMPLQHAAVDYVVTVPGPSGSGVAFAAEFVISALMMTTVLWVSNSKRLSRFTPLFAGALVAAFISVESPLSGMSMNPARTLGSAFSADEWTAVWVYFAAPAAAMLFASVLYRWRSGARGVFCAKLNHANRQPCIFNCRYGDLNAQ